MPTDDDEQVAADRPLERRSEATRSRRSLPDSARQQLLVLPWSAFKQALLKYIRRQTRNERAFCLAKIDILEYGSVEATVGSQAASAVCRAVLDVCVRNLRDVDRICTVKPGELLLLLPESDRSGAHSAVERIAQLVGATKIRHHQTWLHASCALQVVDSRTCGPDPDELLQPFGYAFDDGRQTPAGSTETPVVTSPANLPFSGEFAQWRERYDLIAGEGEPFALAEGTERQGERVGPIMVGTYIDRWRDGRRVDVRVFSPAPSEPDLDFDSIQAIARRARVLTAIDHPGLASPCDYHLRSSRHLYLVYDRTDGRAVAEVGAAAGFGWPTALEWGAQICNILIYLQGLIPPLVPPPLTAERLLVTEKGSLILSDFEIPYLFPAWHAAGQVSDSEVEDVWQGRPVAAYVPVIRSLGRLLYSWLGTTAEPPERLMQVVSGLSADPLPKNLNTVYKIRSALKEAGDAVRVGVAMTSESPRPKAISGDNDA